MDRADVVIVDDDRPWTQAVGQVLHEAGFTVQTAGDGEQGLELLVEARPRLVILDVHMPRLDGMQLLRQFRQRDGQTPVVMISAEDQASIQDRAMSEGANAFLRKPISVSLLLRIVHRFLGERIHRSESDGISP